MQSAKSQRVFSILLGFGLLITGSFFVLPLMVAAYILGLMLIGFGVEPRMVEEPNEIMPIEESRQISKEAPRMSAAPKPKKRAKPKPRKKRPAKKRKKR